MDMAGHGVDGMMTAASMAFTAASMTMMDDMAIIYTGNTDVDFVTGMIGQHQGAVAMARIVLEHGTNPEVRALAKAIIAAQQAEIAWMSEWLAAYP